MALSLKDPETDVLARQVASLTGETLTEAVRTSLRQRLQHERLRRGKGRHRAGLNFVDCFSYALAKATSRPLLFKGDDFGHTDIAVAARRATRLELAGISPFEKPAVFR